jgi:hypothetical protein
LNGGVLSGQRGGTNSGKRDCTNFDLERGILAATSTVERNGDGDGGSNRLSNSISTFFTSFQSLSMIKVLWGGSESEVWAALGHLGSLGLNRTGHMSLLTGQDRTPKFAGRVLPDQTKSGLTFLNILNTK